MHENDEDIRRHLDALEPLRDLLDDLSVRHVRVTPDGVVSFEKLGQLRTAEQVDPDVLDALAGAVASSDRSRLGSWHLRAYRGASGWSLLIERAPVASTDSLPEVILGELERQAGSGGSGLITGPAGADKAGLLLWIARQCAGEPVLLISENPPAELPGPHVVHLFPPRTSAEARDLGRLARLSHTVLWDRITGSDDLGLLFGAGGGFRRWFTLDAAGPSSAIRAVEGARLRGIDARFDAMLVLGSSAIGRVEPHNLVVCAEDGGWREVYRRHGSCLALMEGATWRPRPAQDSPRTIPVELDDMVDDEGADISAEDLLAVEGPGAAANLPDVTRQYVYPSTASKASKSSTRELRSRDDSTRELSAEEVRKLGALIPEMGFGEAGRSADPEELRVTSVQDVDAAQMEELEALRERSLSEVSEVSEAHSCDGGREEQDSEAKTREKKLSELELRETQRGDGVGDQTRDQTVSDRLVDISRRFREEDGD